MDRWTEIENFVRIVENGGIGTAAERLNVAKSAVSRRLKELETRLGVKLINRTTRRLSLTETGRAYFERCQRIMADLEEADDAAGLAHGTLSGRLRVAAPLSFGNRHLAPTVARFLDMHPQIVIDLDLNDRRVDLVADGFDVAIRIGNMEDSTLIARKIAVSRSVLCAAPEFVGMHGPFRGAEDLADVAAVHYSNVTQRRAWTAIDPEGREVQLRICERLACNNGDFLTIAAEAGIGVVMEPAFHVADAVRAGRLVQILTDHKFPELPIQAVYPPARHLSAKVRAFVDHVAQSFGDPPYWEKGLQLPGG